MSPTHKIGVGQLRGHGAERRPGDWDCTSCGAIAFASRPNCYRCGEPRADSREGASPSEGTSTPSPRERSGRRPGDWDCPSCQALVFSSKAACFRCQTPRPPSAGSPAPSSGSSGGRQPVRRAGDWDCPNPSCRALVFASRQVCAAVRARLGLPRTSTRTSPRVSPRASPRASLPCSPSLTAAPPPSWLPPVRS